MRPPSADAGEAPVDVAGATRPSSPAREITRRPFRMASNLPERGGVPEGSFAPVEESFSHRNRLAELDLLVYDRPRQPGRLRPGTLLQGGSSYGTRRTE